MALQKDLDTLVQWASKWQMKFNTSKCTIMRCTRSANPIQFKYTLQETNLEESDKHMYLGVMLDKSLSWSSHITHVANKATRMLNFIKCHLSKCSNCHQSICLLTLGSSLNGVRLCSMGSTLFDTYCYVGEDTETSCQMDSI